MQMDDTMDEHTLARWRLLLGRYSEQHLQNLANLSAAQQQQMQTLDYLYNREYQRRGVMQGQGQDGGGASLDPSQLSALDWLTKSKRLFPKSTFEQMQTTALSRYGMTELMNSPKMLDQLSPSPQIAQALLGMRGRMSNEMRLAVKRLIERVVEEILQRLKPRFRQQFTGRRNRFRCSHVKQASNFDWRATIARNLKHYQQDSQQLVIHEPVFYSRVQNHLPWQVILCVDQSGSMFSSVMYAAICASILAALPAVSVKLVLFDTSVVDLSEHAHDPVEVLMTAQLGGGTNIAQALQYCQSLIETPNRTVLALISDFEEGGSVSLFLRTIQSLASQRVTLLGLAALDEQAQPVYSLDMAQRLADLGMHVAALTPEHFAKWLAEVMQ